MMTSNFFPSSEPEWNVPASKNDDRRNLFNATRIGPQCLRIDDQATVRIGLSVPPRLFFATLHELGETLQLSGNAIAIFGQVSPVPALVDWRNPILPRDLRGYFTPNLAEFASLCAIRETTEAGPLYGFELRGTSGDIFQRIFLTDNSRHDVFSEFVARFQSPLEERVHWHSPNHASSVARCRAVGARIPWLRWRLERGDRDVAPLTVEDAVCLIQEAGRRRIPFRVSFYSHPLIRNRTWTPESQSEVDSKSAVQHFFGDDVGLHLNLEAVESVWLWKGRCACCKDQKWTVELGDNRDRISLAFAAANDADELPWRQLLADCFE